MQGGASTGTAASMPTARGLEMGKKFSLHNAWRLAGQPQRQSTAAALEMHRHRARIGIAQHNGHTFIGAASRPPVGPGPARPRPRRLQVVGVRVGAGSGPRTGTGTGSGSGSGTRPWPRLRPGLRPYAKAGTVVIRPQSAAIRAQSQRSVQLGLADCVQRNLLWPHSQSMGNFIGHHLLDPHRIRGRDRTGHARCGRQRSDGSDQSRRKMADFGLHKVLLESKRRSVPRRMRQSDRRLQYGKRLGWQPKNNYCRH